MTCYLLNSPVLTDYGIWQYRGPISLSEARLFVRQNTVESAIGHLSTAQYLSGILDTTVAVCRQAIRMVPEDCALVFRVLERPEEGVVLDIPALSGMRSEFGILERCE
ncbi:MAG: STIV orfB116 family protein [Acidithiobacillus sp.]